MRRCLCGAAARRPGLERAVAVAPLRGCHRGCDHWALGGAAASGLRLGGDGVGPNGAIARGVDNTEQERGQLGPGLSLLLLPRLGAYRSGLLAQLAGPTAHAIIRPRNPIPTHRLQAGSSVYAALRVRSIAKGEYELGEGTLGPRYVGSANLRFHPPPVLCEMTRAKNTSATHMHTL